MATIAMVHAQPAITIRPERTADRSRIASVVLAAFGSEVEVELVDAIRRSSGYLPDLSLVAEAEGSVIGHVMISHAVLQDGERQHRVATLSPLAVEPARQRRGVGTALVREVTARAEVAGEPLVVLEGSPAYYGRLGFEPSVPHGIVMDLPSWAPPEAAQVLRLTGYDPAVRGRLVFAVLDGLDRDGGTAPA